MYGLEHHIVEISGDVTDAGRTDGRTREDRATQPMEAGWLSFAILEPSLQPIGTLDNEMCSQISISDILPHNLTYVETHM